MPKRNLLVMLLVILTCGIVAAGCGSDDSTSSTTVTADDTTVSTTEDTSSDDTTADETTSDSDNPVDADAFHKACVDAVSGTPAEAAGTTGCDEARTALEQCGEQAVASGNDEVAEAAIKACQDTADQAVDQLESLGG